MFLSGSTSRTRSLRALAEAGLGYTLILITIWSPPSIRNYFAVAAALWIAGVLLFSGDGGAGSGFEISALRRCSWAVALSLAIAAAMIVISAHLGMLHLDSPLTTRRPPMVGYLVWSLIQQVILQLFLMERLLLVLHRPWIAIAVASLLFAAAHLPNPLLVPATLLWGAAACWLYRRYGSLIGVAAIHFVLGACLAICVPATVNRNMRVGLGYIRYHAHSPRAHALAPLSPGLMQAGVPR